MSRGRGGEELGTRAATDHGAQVRQPSRLVALWVRGVVCSHLEHVGLSQLALEVEALDLAPHSANGTSALAVRREVRFYRSE